MRFLLFTLLFTSTLVQAQFAPQIGIVGSKGIHKSSSLIKTWAHDCVLHRGYLNIADPTLGHTSIGANTSAVGIADGNVVSLGDSGVAVLSFLQPIFNGPGADFAVFENGFQNPANLEEAFLELAFVEASSDGVNFVRFPSTSNTNSTVQIAGAGTYMNARYLENFAGKYIAQYGTPFDLEELKGNPDLDIDNVTHIRIVDVVGAISQYGTKDFNGQKINDPYPTPFPSGGFDLDAVAAIHTKGLSVNETNETAISIFPSPATNHLNVVLNTAMVSDASLVVCDIRGQVVLENVATHRNQLDVSTLVQGIYIINIKSASGIKCIGKFAKI
ncbi:MAG: T9SS type A sorting domain-containing protein [Chitinophagaceae bacterium]|nr:T9SS type A sorting domain-containing protein [Chitinophagaceae bacterium]